MIPTRFRRERSLRLVPTRFVVFAALALCGAASVPASEKTALDAYVEQPDDAYRWQVAKTLSGDGYRAYVVDLVSQRWRSAWEVDRTEWRHWLTVIVPEQVDHQTGLLWIGSGSNGRDAPSSVSERVLNLATGTNSVVAELGQVPNQPLHFADSRDEPRHEDDLIAYGRVKYTITGDERWLVRLPMVKSAVRAMDAMSELLASDIGGRTPLDGFVVAGASKRGWTTWLMGIADPRVKAIVPLVIDALNTEAITRRHYGAYGFFSPALGDYVRHGLYPHMLGSPAFDRILAIEDPYLYRHRDSMKLPKYVVNAAGDQYFLPDNSRHYFQAMPDEKHLRYVPNAKHDLRGSDAQETILAYYRMILEDQPRPRYGWTIEDDGTIVLEAEDTPDRVLLWQAENAEARDFRLDTIGTAWTSTELEADSAGRWTASAGTPDRGYRAFFVELTYEIDGQSEPFKVTTDVSVLPDVLPFRMEDHEGDWLGQR